MEIGVEMKTLLLSVYKYIIQLTYNINMNSL